MLIREVMTTTPAYCKPTDTLDTVANLMVENDCGEIPVCDGTAIVGVITDRDITCRAVAAGRRPADVKARDIMTQTVYRVRENASLDTALELMEEELIRRLPVVDNEGKLVGILSQSDLIARMPTLKVARLVKSVAKKTRRHPVSAL